jgi:hypothetical protein
VRRQRGKWDTVLRRFKNMNERKEEVNKMAIKNMNERKVEVNKMAK